jgi:predicted outer membrane repeat protein
VRAQQSTLYYVDATSSATVPDGRSWATAYPDLQDALRAARAGDDIWVAAGVYIPGSDAKESFELVEGVAVYGGFAGTETNRSQRDPATNLTVLSGDIDNDDTNKTDGITPTAADIVGTNTQNIVTAPTEATAATILDGFTLTGGQAGTFDSNRRGCPSTCGGGMFLSNSSPTVADVRFIGNQASTTGGGLYVGFASPTLRDLSFTGNVGVQGGGMYIRDSTLLLTNGVFEANEARDRDLVLLGEGGGLFMTMESDLTITGGRFIDNRAGVFGAGLYAENGTLTATDMQFIGNNQETGLVVRTGRGGGGMIAVDVALTLTNALFAGNNSENGALTLIDNPEFYTSPDPRSFLTNVSLRGNTGSALACNGCRMRGTNLSIAGNYSDSGSGGISPSATEVLLDLRNSIVWGNQTGGSSFIDPNLYIFSEESVELRAAHTLIEGQNPPGTGNLDGTNTANDPLFAALPNPLSAPTSDGDLRLQEGSPAIDAGDNALIAAAPAPGDTTDLAGNARVTDGTVDLGAYESGNQPAPDPQPIEAPIRLVDSGQSLTPGGDFSSSTAAVLLGDVDNDGDLDAITFSGASATGVVRLWLNQGGTQGGVEGVFSLGQQLASRANRRGALGDIDGDGDLDLLMPLFEAGVRVLLNQGGAQGGTLGTFADNDAPLGTAENVYNVALGDLDNDGDPDAIYAAREDTFFARNDGGTFTDVDSFPVGATRLIPADLDGDNDLDLVLDSENITVLLNQATEVNSFTPGQRIDNLNRNAMTVGDVDGDGDLDMIATVDIRRARVFLNQGGQQGGTPATFEQDNQQINIDGSLPPLTIAAGDLNDDDDLDLLVGGARIGGPDLAIWQNDGAGLFSAGETYPGIGTFDLALGDLDGDGDLDAFAVGAGPHRIFLNGETDIAPMLRFGVDPLTGADGFQYIFWWEPFNARLPLLLSHPADDPLPLRVDFVRQTGLVDFGDPDTDNPQFAPGETRVFLTGYEDRINGAAGTIWNPYQDPNEDRIDVTIIASIDRESRSAAGLDLRGEENLRIAFQNPDADARRCIAIGFQIVIASLFNQDRAALAQETLNLDLYRALRDDVLAQSEAGRYFTTVYEQSSLGMLQVAGQQSGVISRTLETLETWEPAMQALVDGEGDTVTITPEMIESMQMALDDYKTFGSANLAGTIASAEAIVDLDSYVGLTMDEALARFETIQIERTYLPLVVR